jgi:hypothetical protein
MKVDMSKSIPRTLVLLFVLSGCSSLSPDATNVNPRAYYDSGHYARDVRRIVADAIRVVQTHPKLGPKELLAGPKELPIPAVFLDIDDTALSDWDYMVSVGFHYDKESFRAWARKGNAPPITPILKLYKEATKRGIPVLFISERDMDLEDATKSNLVKAGFNDDYQALLVGLRPVEDTNSTIAAFKADARGQLEDSLGLKIIMDVGDKVSDFTGGHTGQIFKLPSPCPVSNWPK